MSAFFMDRLQSFISQGCLVKDLVGVVITNRNFVLLLITMIKYKFSISEKFCDT